MGLDPQWPKGRETPSDETRGASAASTGVASGGVSTAQKSVIVVARDRRDELATAIDSVIGQAPPNGAVELIVVDDGSRDGTAEMLSARAEAAARAGGPALVVLRNDAPQGPGRARNQAALRARGETLVFMDSDCRALPGWLAAIDAPLRDPAIGVVGGAEALDPEEPALGRAIHFVLTSALTTGGLRGGAGAKIARYRPRASRRAVRRAAFQAAGGFSGRFHGEDIDLSLRLAARGLALVHAPEARVHHRRRRSLADFLAQTFHMGRARTTLFRLDRRHIEPAYFLPAIALLSALGVAIAALVSPAVRPIAALALAGAGAYLALVGLAAALALRSAAAALLAPIAFAVQQVGYGAGFLAGIVSPERDPA